MAWTPKQHVEHQELLKRMERERKNPAVAPEPVTRKKKKTRRKSTLGENK